MDQLVDLVEGVHIDLVAVIDIALTALLIYGLFSLIQGTRAVRLVIGAIVLYVVYVLAQALNLRLLSGILQTGAVVGLLALVVIFQPELRRGLERIGRVGSLRWLMAPASASYADKLSSVIGRTAFGLSAQKIGALIVVERETGLEDAAESGVMLHSDLSAELLQSIFTPHSALHDGAVILRGDRILAAGAVLPLSETSMHRERYGTRHRAAIGITEQTDALAIVVSEETGQVSLVERGRVLRAVDEERLRKALVALLRPADGQSAAARTRATLSSRSAFVRGKRFRGLRLPPSRPPVATIPQAAAAPPAAPSRPAPVPPAAVRDPAAAVPGSASRAE